MTSVHHKVQFPAHQEPMYTKTKSVFVINYNTNKNQLVVQHALHLKSTDTADYISHLLHSAWSPKMLYINCTQDIKFRQTYTFVRPKH